MAEQYRVVRGTSTRASDKPRSPDFEAWVHWRPGDVAAEWPAHTPVAQLVRDGAWEPVDEKPVGPGAGS